MRLNKSFNIGDTIRIHDNIDDYKGRLVAKHGVIFTVINVSKNHFFIRGNDNVDLKVTKDMLNVFSNIYILKQRNDNWVKIPIVEKL